VSIYSYDVASRKMHILLSNFRKNHSSESLHTRQTIHWITREIAFLVSSFRINLISRLQWQPGSEILSDENLGHSFLLYPPILLPQASSTNTELQPLGWGLGAGIIFLGSINRFICVMEMQCVCCEAGTECSGVISFSSRTQRINTVTSKAVQVTVRLLSKL
jgi:hypothetical protein